MGGQGLPSGSAARKEDLVARHVREGIVTGRLAPGTRLRQQEIGDETGCSPTPVREALRRLVTEGWLELTPHIGVRVTGPDRERAEDIRRLRALIESDLARIAASQVGAADVDVLAGVNAQLRAAGGDRAAARLANFHFHQLVWAATAASLTVGLASSLWVRSPDEADAAVDVDRTAVEHEAVLDALRRGDARAAEAAMALHIQGRSEPPQR